SPCPRAGGGRSVTRSTAGAIGGAQHCGSSQSTRPSWLSSTQLPQISGGGAHAGSAAQSGSAQSVSPSQSLSMPSPHTSGPTTHGQPVTGAILNAQVALLTVVLSA